jgi:ABC-type branched-subunit amino acid transport system substrate-binding protein
MCLKKSLHNKFVVLALVLVLIVPILVACGKEKVQTRSSTPTITATPIAVPTATPAATPGVTQTATATPTSTEPVKIGAIMPWSGPMAVSGMLADQIIALVEEQLKNTGGILGGREVKFIRRDDRGVVAESAGQATKLALDDKVTIMTLGGVTGASMSAVADVAEELKVPFVGLTAAQNVADKKYSAFLYSYEPAIARIANFLVDVVKPKTVAFLAYDAEDGRMFISGSEGVLGVRDRLKAKGIDILYEQYFSQDALDFSSYLAKIKYLKPDILVCAVNSAGQAVTINKQIMELGGWGSMKYFCCTETGSNPAVVRLPGAVGTYVRVMWLAGSDEPGMKAFEDAYVGKYGRLPDPSLTYFYNDFWTAIKAIELANSDDPEKVAQALRSGNLEWDSAWGPLRIASNGVGEITSMVAQVQEGGKLVKVWSQ